MSTAEMVSKPSGRTIGQVTQEINYLTSQAQRLVLGHAIEIGRRLTEAKSMLPHGAWGNWLREEVRYSASSANNMMRIFEAYGSTQMGLFGPEVDCQTFGNLEYSKALALLAVPENEREQFAVDVDAEHISVRQLKAAIRERDDALNRANEAQSRADGWEMKYRIADKARQDATSRQDALEAANKQLSEELSDLKSRPVEIAVQTVDASEQQIQDAVARGKAEAKAQAQEEVKLLREQLRKLKKEQADGKKTVKAAHSEVVALQEKLADAERRAAAQPKNAPPADRSITEVNVLFRQVQEAGARMLTLVGQMDDISRSKMKKVLPAVFRDIADKLDSISV